MLKEFKVQNPIVRLNEKVGKGLEDFFWCAMDKELFENNGYFVKSGKAKEVLNMYMNQALNHKENQIMYFQTITSEEDLRKVRNIVLGLQLLAKEKGLEFDNFVYDENEGAVKSRITKIKKNEKELSL